VILKLKSTICWVLFLLMGFITPAQERPNILWITFEDTSPQFIGCYGNENAETPVIDEMARRGIRYTSAFSTNTVCSPSRTSIITGVPTFKLGTGHHRSKYAIPDFIKGFPAYLREAGYYTSNNYKTDYNVANDQEFIDEAWNESSNEAGWWKRGKNQPFFSVFNINDSHQSRTMSMSYEWYQKNVLGYLPRESKNSSELPDKEVSAGNEISISVANTGDFAGLHQKHWIADSAFAMPSIYRDSPEMRKQMARVYNSLKLTDLKIGKLLNRLLQEGLMENTIIFIFADHGEGMPRMKTNGIGLGYRVPFVVWLPERYKHLTPNGKTGIVNDELVSFEDLAPTVLNLAGVELPNYMEGRVFFGKDKQPEPEYLFLASDRADNGLDLVRSVTDGRYMYSRNFMPFFPEMKYINYIEIGEITQHMREDLANDKLNETQRSLFEPRPVEVLYDLKNDTWETDNLATNPEYASLLSKMRAGLKENILQECDVQFMPEYELSKISEDSTPYNAKADNQYYPLNEILETAMLVGKKDSASITETLSKLEHDNKFVRYWAAMGLYAARKSPTDVALKKISTHLIDDYGPVQVTLAAIYYDLTGNPVAEKMLKNTLDQAKPELALMAINYLLYTSNRTPFIKQVQDINQSDAPYKLKASALDFLNLEGLAGAGE